MATANDAEYLIPFPYKKVWWSQGMIPACVGFATAMAQMVKIYCLTNKLVVLSPYSVYGYYGGNGDGMSTKYGLEAIREWGALPMSEFKENVDNPRLHNMLSSYRKKNENADIIADKFKLNTYRRVDMRDTDVVKSELIKNNPVVTSIIVDKSFGRRNGGIEPQYPRGSKGHHAVCIVGWKRIGDKDYYIAKNSHGDPQGNGGIVYLPVGRCFGVDSYSLTDTESKIAYKTKEIQFVIGDEHYLADGAIKEIDIPAMIDKKTGRTYLPIRFVAESLGCDVAWDGAKSQATLISEEATIVLTKDSRTMLVNGKKVELDAATEIKNNRLMCPIRHIAEAVNCIVQWIPNESKAVITAI